ncbi:hypothetical protein BBD42_20370 [Paenibacillus sp. BIHB 4019]|uniref:Helix-hairpin-helix DNA-binding motif class 1 domain-containing protein n=1 Tax=Paenibacillus sp. BIHB 4019 TaxID=1870819 RepID=A0A1B2DLI2_9BACL|nr:hypothetical protein BBD42_20370 [Paenibacillus sp. BIHB 4019]
MKEKQYGKSRNGKRAIMAGCLLLACGLLGAAMFMPKEQAPSGWMTLNAAVEAALEPEQGNEPASAGVKSEAGEDSGLGKQANGEGQQGSTAANGSSGKPSSDSGEDGENGSGKMPATADGAVEGTVTSRLDGAGKAVQGGANAAAGELGEADAGSSRGNGNVNNNENLTGYNTGNSELHMPETSATKGSSAVEAAQNEPGEGAASSTDSGKLDINRATVQELDGLKGIGPAKAKAIVENREKNGRFTSVDDLQRVKGIGPKLLEGMKDSIVANP